MFGSKKGKNIQVGIGSSKNTDPYLAAKEAAEEAVKECGKQPKFSIVYTNSEYDQKQILKGINEVLGKDWVGSSVDKQIMSTNDFDKETVVSVVSLSSDYLHFGVGVAENYRKDPKKAGLTSIKDAMNNAKADKYMILMFNLQGLKLKIILALLRHHHILFLQSQVAY